MQKNFLRKIHTANLQQDLKQPKKENPRSFLRRLTKHPVFKIIFALESESLNQSQVEVAFLFFVGLQDW
jgi:hypothetical protein